MNVWNVSVMARLRWSLLMLAVPLILSGCVAHDGVTLTKPDGERFELTEGDELSIFSPSEYLISSMDELVIKVHPEHVDGQDYRLDYWDSLELAVGFSGAGYSVGYGDKLEVSVDIDSGLDFSSTVRPDGYISIPKFDQELKVVALTPSEISMQISKIYEATIKEPNVTVSVLEASSDNLSSLNGAYKVDLNGLISLPHLGVFNVRGKTAVELSADIAKKAQSYFNNAIEASVVVENISTRNRYQESLSVNPDGNIFLQDVGLLKISGLSVQDAAEKISSSLQSSHVNPMSVAINIESSISRVVYIGGEIARPGNYNYVDSLNLMQLLGDAGWVKDSANLSKVKIIRPVGEGAYYFYTVNLNSVVKGKGLALNNLDIYPRDMVLIPKKGISKANLWMEQYVMSMLPFNLNMNYNYRNDDASQ